MTGFGTEKFSGLAVVRNIQQNGIHLTCSGDREITSFNIVGARDKIFCGLRYLAAAASAPRFKPWEVSDNLPRLRYEVGSLTPQAHLMEMLHKVAFRRGLGNSLFMSPDIIGCHSSELVIDFC